MHNVPFFSCSDYLAMTLDTNSVVWNLMSWGRPFRLVSPLLDRSSPETTPIQIECGMDFSVVLTRSGGVYVWWPNRGPIQRRYDEAVEKLNGDESTKAFVPEGGTVIPCHTLEIHEDPVELPALPHLPELPGTGLSVEECRKVTKLIKIAALEYRLIGLTNKGHVLKMDELYGKDDTRAWEYVSENGRTIRYLFLNRGTQLSNYSEMDKVKNHPAFHTTTGNDGNEKPPQVELSSDTMRITHVRYIVSMGFQCHV